MRFFYLFTSAAATAVVSNAAVLPRWNNPSIRYSDHAPATSMVNIASESHPPILAIQGYSGTLVSLMRRTPQVESAGGDGSGSGPGSVPSPTSGSGPESGPESESSTSSSSESGPDPVLGPRTRSGPESGPESGPGPESESATQVGASSSSSFLTRIRNKFGGFFKTIQRSTQRLTYALKKLIRKHTGPSREVKAAGKAVGGALGPPLIEYFAKSQKGVESIRDWLKGMGPSLRNLIKQSLAELLSEAKELITSFTDTQQRRYNAIMEMLRRLPKDYRGDQSASNKPSVMQKVKTLFGKKSPQ
ncbi:hypothetical protein BASA62_004814 [Batrachochytrium salamandrivorans]|nr:hypothetical protein BASA62_004814 [Batrachochytrium salamandrivorans]